MHLINSPGSVPDASSSAQSSAQAEPALLRLMYSSVAASDLNADELEALLGICRPLNEANDITGVLFHLHAPQPGMAFFVQLLEGPHDAIEATYAKITRDELHHTVTLLSTADTHHRQFGSWSMALRDLDSEQTEQLHADLARSTPTAALPGLLEWITAAPAMELLLVQAA